MRRLAEHGSFGNTGRTVYSDIVLKGVFTNVNERDQTRINADKRSLRVSEGGPKMRKREQTQTDANNRKIEEFIEFFRKVWVSIKLLSAKFGLPPPPPKRAQNEEKLYKSVGNPQHWYFFRVGGETQFYGQNDFMDIWALLRVLQRAAVIFAVLQAVFQEAAQYLAKGCSRKRPPSFPSF